MEQIYAKLRQQVKEKRMINKKLAAEVKASKLERIQLAEIYGSLSMKNFQLAQLSNGEVSQGALSTELDAKEESRLHILYADALSIDAEKDKLLADFQLKSQVELAKR